MATYIYHKAHRLTQLHDEILAALPALRPIVNTNGDATVVMRIEGRESEGFLRITIPEGASERPLRALVAAHRPDPHYGAPPTASDVELLAMNEKAFRQWVARRLLAQAIPA